MTQIGFYHLTTLPLEQALPRLLDKARSAGLRVVVMAGSAERVAYLDNLLWTWVPESWLPHGTARDPDAALTPVVLTDGEENPNGADMLMLTDGVGCHHLESFSRCLNLFDGRDEEAVATARSQWKTWKESGHELVYYQQTPEGKWIEKARTAPSPSLG